LYIRESAIPLYQAVFFGCSILLLLRQVFQYSSSATSGAGGFTEAPSQRKPGKFEAVAVEVV
jgi:hypothetical protein